MSPIPQYLCRFNIAFLDEVSMLWVPAQGEETAGPVPANLKEKMNWLFLLMFLDGRPSTGIDRAITPPSVVAISLRTHFLLKKGMTEAMAEKTLGLEDYLGGGGGGGLFFRTDYYPLWPDYWLLLSYHYDSKRGKCILEHAQLTRPLRRKKRRRQGPELVPRNKIRPLSPLLSVGRFRERIPTPKLHPPPHSTGLRSGDRTGSAPRQR